MKQELQNKLFNAFPAMFIQEDWSIQGITAGDGWYDVIYDLCTILMQVSPKTRAVQVKEKFGGLRFYVDTTTEEGYKAIDASEELSLRTCEDCGGPGSPNDVGWITTLCDSCREIRNTGNVV